MRARGAAAQPLHACVLCWIQFVSGAGILPHLRDAGAPPTSEPDTSTVRLPALTEALWWGARDECCLSQACARTRHLDWLGLVAIALRVHLTLWQSYTSVHAFAELFICRFDVSLNAVRCDLWILAHSALLPCISLHVLADARYCRSGARTSHTPPV